MVTRLHRPKVIKSTTERLEVACESLFVTIGYEERDGEKCPIEVIVRLGKNGGCAYSQCEALGRAISIGLQCGAPAKEYVATLRGIRCENPKISSEKILSCSDAIGAAIERFLNENGKGT